ncbi:Ubiquitin-associated/translation elongation factor EF1B N-terminal eukaryote [Penicillium riverlandense]|uniref:Ubiquitin-associated/translation elongation factor EF1B N-terminal eukaryote n=1 Tax=Penicillium riverlandense TaxID=1903569 RepID=UPI0025485D6D|nr:Ubiquitin-associated/translation elongation factor EF1B N-terminal eukaryote [Penicillium riverlandense]KAJ5831894.1 Ubiquitin-associated/translation elongation factor EF1B N-terminal eukaryote [Penicillium riverlandense]
MSSGLLYASARPNGTSGRSTPVSTTSNRSSSPVKPAPSAGDSFANLVSFGPSAGNKNLSLVEQQKRLQEEKAKKDVENRTRFEAQYGGQNNQFWDSLEQGRAHSPAVSTTNAPRPAAADDDDDDDILAAFNSAAPVDASTNFPIPSPRSDANRVQSPASGGITMRDNTEGAPAFDDDDPFGLNQLKPKSAPPRTAAPTEDDDFLGLLGKPVSEIPRPESPSPAADVSPVPSNEADRAIAELVDMGFPADKARQALQSTESGTDVQAAVGWLLTQAHSQSRQKSQTRRAANGPSSERMERNNRQARDAPSWMREDSRSQASAEKDPAQLASQFGNNLLKSATSLWKTGNKRFQQVVHEFNADHDPNQPKWMRDASPAQEEPWSQPQPSHGRGDPAQSQTGGDSWTDEALLLESGDSRPPRKPTRPRESPQPGSDLRSPGTAQPSQRPSFLQRPPDQSRADSRSPLSRAAAEQQSAQAYVSPARRRRPQAPPPAAESNVDLFESPAPSSSSRPTPPTQTPRSAKPSTPLPVRSKAPPRSIPPVSQEALQSTHRHREKASEAYKRGDYAAAHQSFSTALSMLPDKHPITIIIRSNRAMTALKIGEPKSAIDDADAILQVIGPFKGEAEMIELGNGEPNKQMKDLFGKALMRKAEALEQLERWVDAAQAWKLAVESGHGGSTSIQGRNRCEKAAGISKPPPKAPAKKKPTPAPRKPASALSDLTGGPSTSGQDSEAVTRLRAANQAADRADEEKFALSDSVDARLTAWKNGKQDNLRALLGSLDTVLWPEAGWKKINMSELVLPNKVKIQYMKGIAKVHPDKISTTATTEQRMISSAVFGTLNEAWDKFKAENNL